MCSLFVSYVRSNIFDICVNNFIPFHCCYNSKETVAVAVQLARNVPNKLKSQN